MAGDTDAYARTAEGVGGGPRPADLARSAVRGSAWTLIGFAAGQALRLGSNLLLTRLLFPAVFGQMVLIQIFVQGLGMFSDIGTGPAIVQNPRGDDPRFLNTLWSMACVRGLLLWAATWLIAAPVAAFYDQPILRWLVPASGFAAVLQGLESTSLHALKRHFRLGRLTVVDVASQAAGVVMVVLLVLAHRSLYGANHPGAIWALVAGNLLGAATRLFLSHAALPGIRHRLAFDREDVRRQLTFGRWVFVSTALTFLAGHLDRLIFGKAIPMELLGVYGIAVMASSLPSQAVLKVGWAVVFPAFSRIAVRSDFARTFAKVRLVFLLGGAVLVSGLIATGPPLVRLLYDPRYGDAGWILRYLAVLAWFQILGMTNEAAMLAIAKPHWLAAGNLAKAASLLALVPLGFHLRGFEGALVALVGSEVCRYGVSAVAAARRGLGGIGRDVATTALISAIAAIGAVAGRAAGASPHPDLVAFLLAGTAVAGTWALLVLAGARRMGADEVLALLRRG